MRAPKRAGLGHLESWGRRCGEDGQKNPAELEIKRLIKFVTHSHVWWYPPRLISMPPYKREREGPYRFLQCAATERELSINLVSSPDLMRYTPGAILKAIRAGVGFGSGTETSINQMSNVNVYLQLVERGRERGEL